MFWEEVHKGTMNLTWQWFIPVICRCFLLELSLTNVTSHECYHQLLSFGALASRFGNYMLIEQLHSSLEAGELHHGVGNLPHPQRDQTLIETEFKRTKGRGGSQIAWNIWAIYNKLSYEHTKNNLKTPFGSIREWIHEASEV